MHMQGSWTEVCQIPASRTSALQQLQHVCFVQLCLLQVLGRLGLDARACGEGSQEGVSWRAWPMTYSFHGGRAR